MLSACVWQCYGSGWNGHIAALCCGALVLRVQCWGILCHRAWCLQVPKKITSAQPEDDEVCGNHYLKSLSLRGATNLT